MTGILPLSSSTTLFAVLALLTSANLFHSFVGKHDTASVVARVTVGDTVRPEGLTDLASLGPAGRASEPVSCRLIVVFTSQCPFCREAAAREESNPHDIPTVWVGRSWDLGIREFATRLDSSAQVVQSDHLWEELGIAAVPAGIILDSDNVVRRVWIYRGDEPDEELVEACRSPVSIG